MDEAGRGAERRNLRRRVVVLVVLAIVMVVVSVGTWVVLTAADRAVTAEGGTDYSTDAYSVTFPGSPEVGELAIPSTELSVETATWSNKQKMYAISYLAPYGGMPSVDGALESSLQNSGATLVDSEAISIDGGSGVVAQSTAEEEIIWTMIIVSDRGELFTLVQSGENKDQAYFDSFHIR
ncbi:hypothetical protein [Microbacterium trichothecenolyticum]|uniref:Uncharacterized protein n=1 Tax=Microbacterium trichothecenolyticum TaxID=69370 RepID=A0A0M2HF49_MICTR|nr:hypothetical protein [Microbacterium trichothecenolyticum]KJL45259.1 hypothetical protein RS82_00286 [Microbacterium trichothecenolyticum]